MPDLITVPGLDDLPMDDWMIECDGCHARVRADRRFEGSGAPGRDMVRRILAEHGWIFTPTRLDICPACKRPYVLGREVGQWEIQCAHDPSLVDLEQVSR